MIVSMTRIITVSSLRCIEREDKQCHGSYVIEREKDDPSLDPNRTHSAIRADVLSQLD